MRISAKLRKEIEAAQVVEAPKRKRRTKAEIAADEAAALAAATNESSIPDLSDSVNDSKTEEE